MESFTFKGNIVEPLNGIDPDYRITNSHTYIPNANFHWEGTSVVDPMYWGILPCDQIIDKRIVIKDNKLIAYRDNIYDEPYATRIVVPEGVTHIYPKVFEDCYSLEEVVLPSTLVEIGERAFYGCLRLQEIKVNAEIPPAITSWAFSSATFSDAALFVPFISGSKYDKADVWKRFTNITHFVPDGLYGHHILNCKDEPLEGDEFIYITDDDTEVRRVNGDGHVYENCYCIYCNAPNHNFDGYYCKDCGELKPGFFEHHILNCKDEPLEGDEFIYITDDDTEVRRVNGDGHAYADHFCQYCGMPEAIEPALNSGEYVISNIHELLWYRNKVNSLKTRTQINAIQTADIDLSEVCSETMGDWTPISAFAGSSQSLLYGHYDGMGHKITGLYINNDKTYQGFFGIVGWTGYTMTIRSLSVTGDIHCKGTSGIVCGSIIGTIENCESHGSMTATEGMVGGICGRATGSLFSDLRNYASVTSNSTQDAAAGIISMVPSTAEITRCFNEGNINARIQGGGITSGACARITYCGNTGTIANAHGGIANRLSADTEFVGCWTTNGPIVVTKGTRQCTLTGCYTATEIGDLDNVANGQLAYLLGPDFLEGSPWGQTLGQDAHPAINAPRIYLHHQYCVDTELEGDEFIYYTNDDSEIRRINNGEHTSVNCRCIYCGMDTHHWVDHVCTECGERMKCQTPTFDPENGLRCTTPGAQLHLSTPSWEATTLTYPSKFVITIVATCEGYTDSDPITIELSRLDLNNDGTVDQQDFQLMQDLILGR